MSQLTIIPRANWKPAPLKSPRQKRDPSSIREVFIHWPGGKPRSWRDVNKRSEEAATIRGFERSHQAQGWSTIGYNHVMGNGGFGEHVPRIWVARGAQYTPAAQQLHNSGTLACCLLVGPDDPITDALVRRLRSYIRWAEGYTGNKLRIRGHRSVTATDCPGPQLTHAINSGKLDIH